MTLYLSASGIDKRRFVGTNAWFFLIVNLFKVPFSMGLGLLHRADVARAGVLAPPVLLGGLLGYALVRGSASARSTSPSSSPPPSPPRPSSSATSGGRQDRRRGGTFHGVTTCGDEALEVGAPGTSRCAQQLGERGPQVHAQVVVQHRGQDAVRSSARLSASRSWPTKGSGATPAAASAAAIPALPPPIE